MKTFYIDHFVNEQSFIDLQINFLKQDFFYQMDPEPIPFERSLRKEDFYINEQKPLPHSQDPNGTSYTTKKKYFFEEHLIDVISNLSTNYLEDFYDYIREDLLDDQKQRRKFLNDEKKRIDFIFQNINQFEFIGLRKLNELKAQLIEIEKAVHSPTLYNDKHLKLDRLTLNGWNETDLVTFFHFLRKEKVIDFISDGELGKFLERNFCVVNDNDEISSLERLNKKLNDFKNVNRMNDKSLKRLRNLFEKI